MSDTLENRSDETTQEQESSISRQFQNHTITLTDDFRFEVQGPEFTEDIRKVHDRIFDSLAAAKAAISHRIAESRKVAQQNIKLDIRLIDGFTGEGITVQKISRASGEIIGKHERTSKVYPFLPWVTEALRKRVELRRELENIDKSLSDIEISSTRSHGRRIDAEDYSATVQKLLKEVTAKLEIAKKKTLTAVPAEEEESAR